jgi:hypothetical protein
MAIGFDGFGRRTAAQMTRFAGERPQLNLKKNLRKNPELSRSGRIEWQNASTDQGGNLGDIKSA